MHLASQIYQLRTARHLSQADLAEALEVSRQSVSKWETAASVPDLDKLVSMSKLFGVTLDAMVNGSDAEPDGAAEAPPPPPPAGRSTAQIIGIILLCFAGAALLLCLLLFGDLFSGLLLGLPLVIFGVICLKSRHPGFHCLWCACLMLGIYSHLFMRNTPLSEVLCVIRGYYPPDLWSILSVFLLLFFVLLIFFTIYRLSQQEEPRGLKRAALALPLILLLSLLVRGANALFYGTGSQSVLALLYHGAHAIKWLQLFLFIRLTAAVVRYIRQRQSA